MPKYNFLVQETVKRDRIYTIKAGTEAEALNLLDGFKQEPKIHKPMKENLEVLDYDIKEIWLPSDAPEEV